MTFSLSPEPGEQVKDDSDVDDGASVIQTSPLNSTSVAGAVAGKPYVVIESKLKQVTDDALHSQVDAVPLNEYPSKQLVRESLNDMVPDFEATDGESILKWADSLAATVGDTYYLVGVGWVRELLEELFKEGDWSKSVAIDQTKLQEEIKAKLASLSYRNKASEPVVMPITEEVWEYLQTSFGGGPEYAWTFYNIMNTRQDVTRSDVLSMVLKHYISIKVILSTHLDECKIMHVNNFMPIADFKKQVMESFDLEEEHPDTIRIHDFFQYNFGLRIDNSGKDTLKDVPIIHNNPIFVELPVFQPEFSRRRVYLIKPKAAAPTPSYGFQYRMAQTDEFQAGSAPVVQGGFGLRNLGNTCYMNSTLQCLSNIPVLREYFLTRSYEEEINKDNPLGYEGKLATGFASLLSMLWSSTDSGVISPGGFKKMIGKIKPEFAGSFQHDSQEFLSQVLDGLHEDLNRVKNKPYTENPEGDGRPDEVVAKEALETHKKRNNSIINDLFTGLFKSTVTCPDPSCNNVSVTFDPYMILPLPLEAAEQHYEVKSVVFVPAKISATNAIRAEHVICPKDGPSFLLRRLLEQKLTIQGETSLLLFRADGTLMTDIITDWEPLNANTGASQNIFAYELEKAEDFINLISPSASSWERALASTSLMNANEAGKDASPEEKQISLASAPEDIIGLKGCPLLVNDVWESAYQFNEVEQLLRFEVLEVSLMSKDDLKEYKSKLKSKSGEDAELVYLNANSKSTDGFAYIKVSVDTQENINSPEFRSSTTSETNFVLEGVYRFKQSKSIMLDTTAAATTRTKEVRSRVVSTASKTPPRMKPTESSKEVKLQRPSSRLNFGFLKRNKKKKKTAQLVQQYEEKIKPKKTKVDPMKKKKIMSERSEGSTSSEKSIPKETYDEMCTRATSLAPEGLEVSSGLVVGKIWLRPLGDTVQHSKKVPAKFVKYRPFKSYAAAEADPARAAFSLTLNFGKSHEACWGKFLNDTGFALGEIFIRRSRSRGWGEASAKNGKINADTHLLAEKATQDVKLVIMCNRIDAVDSFYTNTSAARKINFKAMPFVYVLPSAISETEFWYLLKEELSTYIEIEKTSSSVSLSDDVSEDEYFQTKLDTLTENLKIVRSNQRFSHTKQYVGYGKDKIESKVGKNLKQSSKTPLFLEQEDVTAYLVGIWSNPEEKAAMPDVLNLTRPSNILSLKPSKKPKAVNFYSAVELFSKSEKLSSMNSWYCSKCKKHQEAFKQLQIWSVPEVLVVQFKRFSQKEGKSIADKLDTAVDFPETVNLKDFVLNAKLSKDEQNFEYDLVAMTCHLGNGLTFGHYVAAARNSEDGCWYSYNDSQVNKISAEEMKRRYAKDGYVIFYIRKDLRPASWDTTSPAILKNEANIEIDSPQSFL